MNETKAIKELFETLQEYFFHQGSLSDGEIGELMANAKIENDSKDALIARQAAALRVLAGLVDCGGCPFQGIKNGCIIIHGRGCGGIDKLIDYALKKGETCPIPEEK